MKESDIYGKDPLSILVLEKLKLKPRYIVLGIFIFAVANLILQLVDSLPDGLDTNEMIRITEHFVWEWLFDPAFAYFYFSFPSRTVKMLQSLVQNKFLAISANTLEQYLPFYRSKWCQVISYAGGAIWAVHFVHTRAFNLWRGESIYFTVSGTLLSFVGGIILGNLLYASIVNVIVVNRVLKGKLKRVHISAPDACGGFKELRDYAVNITYILIIGGIVLVFTQYKYITLQLTSAIWYEYILNPVFIVIATVSFFTPLYRAHKELTRVKKTHLEFISIEINKVYYELVNESGVNSNDLKSRTNRLNELRDIYSFTKQLPDWPFDIQAVRSYFASIATPLIAFVVSIAQWAFETYILR